MYLCRAITEDNLHVRTDRLCTHADAATKEEARRFVEQKLGEIEISVDNLRAQIAGETYRLLPPNAQPCVHGHEWSKGY